MARNRTDTLDAALIARFRRAHMPSAWTPPAAHLLRELRELVRRCDALKAARVQELNRRQAGFAARAVAASITAHLEWLGQQIEAVAAEVRQLIRADPVLSQNLALVRSTTGFGAISATVLLAELPNIAEFTPKALAAFASRMTAAGKPPKSLPAEDVYPPDLISRRTHGSGLQPARGQAPSVRRGLIRGSS